MTGRRPTGPGTTGPGTTDLRLDLPTGALIAGDAATVFADARPLAEGLPTGSFPVRVAAGGLEVSLGGADPVAWTDLPVSTPSGYAALLDAASLAEYTDLGDEPVDEFELLTERMAARDAAVFQGVLAVRADAGAATLRLGRDRTGAACRIELRTTAAGSPADAR
jgi:hypothetical protein